MAHEAGRPSPTGEPASNRNSSNEPKKGRRMSDFADRRIARVRAEREQDQLNEAAAKKAMESAARTRAYDTASLLVEGTEEEGVEVVTGAVRKHTAGYLVVDVSVGGVPLQWMGTPGEPNDSGRDRCHTDRGVLYLGTTPVDTLPDLDDALFRQSNSTLRAVSS